MRLLISNTLVFLVLLLLTSCDLYSLVSDTQVVSSADNSYKIVQWFNEHEINLYYVKEKFDHTTLDSATIGQLGDSIYALVPLYDFFSQLPDNMLSAYKYHSIYIGDIANDTIAGLAFGSTGNIFIDNRQRLVKTYSTIAHEFGHIVYYWCTKYRYTLAEGTPQEVVVSSINDTSTYRQQIRGMYGESLRLFYYPLQQQVISANDYITEYSMKNNDENFAEHFEAIAIGTIENVDINRSELLKAKILFIQNKIFGGVEPPGMPKYYDQPYE